MIDQRMSLLNDRGPKLVTEIPRNPGERRSDKVRPTGLVNVNNEVGVKTQVRQKRGPTKVSQNFIEI